MLDNNEKSKVSITGRVQGFSKYNNYKNELIETITILCFADELKKPKEVNFNFSSKWKNQNLSMGDFVSFFATVKITPLAVHKDERWIDSWNTLPPELTDFVDFIEIKSPSKVKKLSSFDKVFLGKK